MVATIFIVDDDAIQLGTTEDMLARKCGYQTVSALGGKAAIERFLLRMAPRPDLILLDLIMPEVSGLEVIRLIRRSDAHIPIIALSPHENGAMLMEAMQAGANDYLLKPVSLHYMQHTIERQLRQEAMRRELDRLARYQSQRFTLTDVIGPNSAMQAVRARAKRAAGSTIPVCLEGEEGSGRELLARAIHGESDKAELLFGVAHPQGPQHRFVQSLHGQTPPKDSLHLQRPAEGCLLFRDIDGLDMALQEKLAERLMSLRAQEQAPWQHTRFMASCTQPLAALYRQGRIHEKLYFYFSACVISLPPLRERGADVIDLAQHYLQRYTATESQLIRELAPGARELLMKHHWPGNIPELMNLMQRAAHVCHQPVLEREHLLQLMRQPGVKLMPAARELVQEQSEDGKGGYSLLNHGGELKPFEQIEAEIIRFAIEHYGGKMTEVARRLGIGRSTLYRKMQDYKLRQAA